MIHGVFHAKEQFQKRKSRKRQRDAQDAAAAEQKALTIKRRVAKKAKEDADAEALAKQIKDGQIRRGRSRGVVSTRSSMEASRLWSYLRDNFGWEYRRGRVTHWVFQKGGNSDVCFMTEDEVADYYDFVSHV